MSFGGCSHYVSGVSVARFREMIVKGLWNTCNEVPGGESHRI